MENRPKMPIEIAVDDVIHMIKGITDKDVRISTYSDIIGIMNELVREEAAK